MGSKSKHETNDVVKKNKKKYSEVNAEVKQTEKKRKAEKLKQESEDDEYSVQKIQRTQAEGGKLFQQKVSNPVERKDNHKVSTANSFIKDSKFNAKTANKFDSDSDSSSSDSSVDTNAGKKSSSSSSDEQSISSDSDDSDSDDVAAKSVKTKAKPTSKIVEKAASPVHSKKNLGASQKVGLAVKPTEKRKLGEPIKSLPPQVETSRKKQKLVHANIYSSSENEEEPVEDPKDKKEKQAESEKDDRTSTDCFLEGWTKHDVFELINRMSLAIPNNDTLKFNSRVEKLNWEQIKFNKYSPEDCKERWKQIEKRLRGYRILEELLVDAKEWIEKPWTDFYRSGKKNRHPDLPKRPLTSYMLFYLEKKEKYAKQNPGLEMTSLSKVIAEKYKNLPKKKRDRYNKLAQEMREEYKEKMQKFIHDHPVEAMKISKNAMKKGPPGMPGPVKPVPPFKLFMEAKLKQHKSDEDFNSAEFILECKKKWKALSDKKKVPWIRWAHENEVKYLDEIKLYKSENPIFEAPNFKSVLSKEEKIIMDRMQGKPEKPPNSAYSLFSRVMLKDETLRTKYDTPKERMQEIAKQWKAIPKSEKEMYAEEVKRRLDSYKMEYAAYLESLTEEQRKEELANNLPKRKPKAETGPKSKLKQPKITEILNESQHLVEKAAPTETRDIFSREPPKPPSEPYLIFKQEFMKDGEKNEKKAKKAWLALSEAEKENYKLKLEELKQQFFIDYKEFLTNLNPSELKAYSAYRDSSMMAENKEESSGSDDSDTSSSESSDDTDDDVEEDDEDDAKQAKLKKGSDSSDSSSSSDDSD